MTDVYKSPKAELREPIKAGEYGSVEKALAGDYRFGIKETIKEAWNNLKGVKTKVLLGSIIYIVIIGVIGGIFGYMAATSQGGTRAIYEIANQILAILVGMPMIAGVFMISLKHSVSAPTELGEIFRHYDKAFRLLWMTILMYIMIILGLILLILPGIYLMFAYYMAIPLVVEKNMGAWQALETSRKAVSKKWWTMAGFMLSIGLICLLGAVALLIGLIWAIPLATLAYAIVYRNMFGVEAETLK